MEPLVPGVINLPPRVDFVAQLVDQGLDGLEAQKQYELLQQDEIWVNDLYQVNVNKHPDHNFPGMDVWHLSIKRRDRAAIHDWRDLQEIKNQLVGPDCEAIELYPSESRKVDTANQYHLWAFPGGAQVPVGWTTRAVDYRSTNGAVQRPEGA